MAFERSPLGQQNRRLFLRVDVTLYVEGGDLIQGNNESYDINYWSKMFLVFRPNVRVRCLPRGEKSTLKQLHDSIVMDDIKNVFIAIDSDYDFQSGEQRADDRVLYTFGYSWENDIWENENGINVFYNICPVDPSQVDISADFAAGQIKFLRKVRHLLRSDMACVQSGVAIVPRRSPESFFRTMSYGDEPDLNRVRIRACVKNALIERASKSVIVKGQEKVPLELPRYCVGKLLNAFMFKLVTFLIRKNGIRLNVSKQAMPTTAIMSLYENLMTDQTSQIYIHHKKQFDALPIV